MTANKATSFLKPHKKETRTQKRTGKQVEQRREKPGGVQRGGGGIYRAREGRGVRWPASRGAAPRPAATRLRRGAPPAACGGARAPAPTPAATKTAPEAAAAVAAGEGAKGHRPPNPLSSTAQATTCCCCCSTRPASSLKSN